MARMGREPVLGDVSELKFARRPAANTVRERSSRPYMVLSILAAVAFAGVVIAMLDRSAGTAGRSPVPSPSPASSQSPNSVVHRIAQPAVPSVDSSFDVPPAQDWRRPDRFVYQCIGASGAKAYQSHPCGASQREVGVYAATPETKRDVEVARIRQQRRVAASETVTRVTANGGAPVSYGPSYDQRSQQRAACSAARAHQESVLRTVGLRRTHDLLRRLQEGVYEACKGLTP
jgi:hypothetical protein